MSTVTPTPSPGSLDARSPDAGLLEPGSSDRASSERRSERRVAWIVAGAAFLVLSPGLLWAVSSCKGVVGGLRVLDGELPYRDFWTMYAPGQFYVQALLFRIFGLELLPQAIATLALRAVGAAVLFLIVRRIGASRRMSYALAGLLALMFWEGSPELTSYPPALALLLLALERAQRYFRGEGATRLFQAGLCAGAAAWFKHDVAAYLAAGIGIAVCLSWWGNRDGRWTPPARSLARLSLGCALAIAPVALFFAWNCGSDVWHDLIVFPATDFRKVRGEGWPGLLPDFALVSRWFQAPFDIKVAQGATGHLSGWVFCRAPELVFLAGVSAVALLRRRLAPADLATALLALGCMPFYWYAAHVQQNTHPYTLAMLSMLLFALAWARIPLARRGWRGLLLTFGLLYGAGLAIRPASQLYLVAGGLTRSEPLALPGTDFRRVSHREASFYRGIAAFVRAHTAEDERIYCGLTRHDAVVINNQRFYFFCDRPCATRYNELHPGVTDHIDVQREMIAELERDNVRCAILWKFGWTEDVLEAVMRMRMALLPGLGSPHLDEYFREHFEPVFEKDEYVVVWRKGAPRPWER